MGQPAGAQAPTDIALDRFDPAPAGDSLMTVPDATVAPGLRPSFGLMGVYARDPLVLLHEGDERDEIGKIVTHQLIVHALASLDLGAIAKLHVDVPVTVSQGGDSPSVENLSAPSPDAAAWNDVRAGVRFAFLGQQGWVPAVAASATVWVPTGDEDAYSGTGGLRYALALHAGGDHPGYLWRAAIGRRRQHDSGSLQGILGSDVFFAAGGAVQLGSTQIGPEVVGSTVAANGVDPFQRSSTHLEALMSARHRLGGIVLGAGAGAGLTRGIGTPSFRGILSAAYSPVIDWVALQQEQQRERDRDASRSRDSSSPRTLDPQAGLEQDQDGDGVVDADDVCPTVVGERNNTKPGCPSDADGDGIVDMDDQCPREPGVASDDPQRHGCPSDSDRDGIMDALDACPDERGPSTEDPRTRGCPEAVRVVGTQIVILERVQFATGKDDIASESFGLLEQVARVLEDRPDIARVAVDGHTDNVGLEATNLSLSRRRAISVVRWLVGHGVDERRLEARGFGPRRPIAPNDTEEDRAKNRRVEFQILKRTSRGESGWKDGDIDD